MKSIESAHRIMPNTLKPVTSKSVHLLDFALAELFVEASLTGKLTLADRYGLMAAMLTESLSDEERFAIDRLLYAVSRGRVKVVNELSNVVGLS